MYITILLKVVTFHVMVNAHPLIQNIQPYPITTYQQNTYRPPYAEALIVQPSKINSYSQQYTIPTPLPSHLTLQAPLSTEHVGQMYFDKVISNPSLRNILDPNNIMFNQYGTDRQTNQPYNTGGVVNNYIIVSPDYINLNETVKDPKDKVKNKKGSQENSRLNTKKKKVLNTSRINIKDAESPNNKTQRKIKEHLEQSRNFNTDIIKCFTTADVLENEKGPEKKVHKTKKVKKKCNRKKKTNPKLTSKCENKKGSQKPRKLKQKKLKNNVTRSQNNVSKEKNENIPSKRILRKKTKQRTKELQVCKCPKEDKVPENELKVVEDISQSPCCDQDMNDFLLSSLLQQGCTNLENRCTRNSKSDKAIKDILNIYPDLSGDLSKSLAWYMNDFLSPHASQYGSGSSSFVYPFDLSHIYQIPQYSNTDVNKSKGNTERNKTTRRKKKKKKNSKSRATKENDANNENSTASKILDKDIKNSDGVQILEIDNQSPELNPQITKKSSEILNTNTLTSEIMARVPEIKTEIVEKNSHKEPKSADNIISTNKENILDETASISNETTEIARLKSIISIAKALEYLKDSIQYIEERPKEQSPKIDDQTTKFENEKPQERYESQIPNSVEVFTSRNNTEILKGERVSNEVLPNNHIFNQLPDFGLENEIINMLLHDYYPDFRADNHAYLVSDEELDLRNIHDRYFYVTDENMDSREIYTPEQESHFSYKKVYNEDKLDNPNDFDHNNDNKNVEKDKSEEIVFRTPPGLDVPDFVTRKISKDKYDSNEIYYQHSFEDDFDRFSFDSFPDKSDNIVQATNRCNENKSGCLVETVYAKSKVVKYGQSQGINKPFEPETRSVYPGDEFTFQHDGDKTVVIAKSLRPEEYW